MLEYLYFNFQNNDLHRETVAENVLSTRVLRKWKLLYLVLFLIPLSTSLEDAL